MNPKWETAEKLILLPELKMINQWQQSKFRNHYKCFKESEFEICPYRSFAKTRCECFRLHRRRLSWPVECKMIHLPFLHPPF
jgi:hypothetical protein